MLDSMLVASSSYSSILADFHVLLAQIKVVRW